MDTAAAASGFALVSVFMREAKMKRLRSLALCVLLAVSFGYTKALAAGYSDNDNYGAVQADDGRLAAGDASTVLNRAVVIPGDTVDCVTPLHGRASFSVTARGEQLRYQWQIRDPKTDLWTAVSEQYVGAFRGAADSTLSFTADAYTQNALLFRCVVTDIYGNTAVSSPAALRVTYDGTGWVNAADFGADGTDGRDDSAAIQAALDFAGQYADQKHPVTVSLPDGSYDIVQTLVISSHIRFVLSDGAELNYRGDNGCLLQGGGNYLSEDTQDYETLTDVTVRGGRWNAGADAGKGITAPIILINASDICICDLDMRQSSCHFVMLVSVKNANIAGCTFHDSFKTGDGIPYCREAILVGYVKNSYGKVLPSENVTVSDCVFDDADGGVGVRYADEKEAYYTSHVTVENCVFRRLSAGCVNADGVTGLTVKGCRASDCGAFLYAYRTGGNVSDNVINGTGERCISLTGGSVVNITDNHISHVGAQNVPARVQSKGRPAESALVNTTADRHLISGVLNRASDPTTVYKSYMGNRYVPSINARTVNASPVNGKDNCIAVCYNDSMGSVTGNTMTNIDGQGVWVENGTSLTVISDNDFRNIKGTGVHISGTKAAVMRNRFDDPAKSVVIEPLSPDGKKQDVYHPSATPSSAAAVVMQSDSVEAASGESVGFSVAAEGSGLSYQWYYRPKASCFWSVWYGHTSAAEMTVASPLWDGRQVCCVITDQDGRSVAAHPVRVTLRSKVLLTVRSESAAANMTNAVVKPGEELSFSVQSFGFYRNFQWYYRRKNDLTWTKWNTKAQKLLSARAAVAWDGVEVYCKVRNARTEVDSPIATATVIPLLGFFSQPESVTADSGEPISFSVEAYGAGLQYRWYYRASRAEEWKLWASQDDAVALTTADALWNGREVCCHIYDAYGQYETSRAATVTVKDVQVNRAEEGFARWDGQNDAPVILSQPKDVTVREGDVPAVSIEVSGSDLRWQWYCQETTAAPWRPLIGYDTPSVGLPTELVRGGVWVRCEVKDGKGRRVVSEPARVNVIDRPVIVKHPKNVNVKPGEKAVFAIKAFGTALRYQWYRRMPGDSRWSVWQGRTASSFAETADALWCGMEVCCVVTDRDGMQATSETAYVNVSDGPAVIEQPESVSVPAGGKFTLSVKAAGDGVSCRWYFRRPGSNQWTVWKNQTGCTVSATANAAWDGMQVRCVLTDRWRRRTVSQTATVRLAN